MIKGKGKWKENYFIGKLKFEGEYLKDLGNGKGKGKEYNNNGELLYEEEYLKD